MFHASIARLSFISAISVGWLGCAGGVSDPGHSIDAGAADLATRTDALSSSPDLSPPPRTKATAYQINPAHTGAQPGETLTPPLVRLWSVDLGAAASYPLIADGGVFVTSRNKGPGYGTAVHALHVRTGQALWGPISIDGTYYWSNATYDNGTLFVLNYDGMLRSFAAATGKTNWSVQLPGQYSFSSPPTASGGMVYVSGAGSGGTVYGVQQDSGAVVWTAGVANGSNSSPTVGTAGVFASYACNQAYGFEPLAGTQLWHHRGSCSGGGGKTTALAGDRLYTRDFGGNLILNAVTGQELGSFSSKTIPALMPPWEFTMVNSQLQATNVSTHDYWLFAGDGQLSSAPIVANEHVYVGSTAGNIYALQMKTGQTVWSDNVGSAIPSPDEQNVSQPLTGMAIADHTLIITAGSQLVAYGPAQVELR